MSAPLFFESATFRFTAGESGGVGLEVRMDLTGVSFLPRTVDFMHQNHLLHSDLQMLANASRQMRLGREDDTK